MGWSFLRTDMMGRLQVQLHISEEPFPPYPSSSKKIELPQHHGVTLLFANGANF